MIHVINKRLQQYEVHLASSSPRRQNILQNVGMTFKVTPSTFEENLDKKDFAQPKDYCLENAKQKALDVMKKLNQEDRDKKRFIIGTDTVVVADNQILEKPKTHENAYAMLKRLYELKVHEVCSGVVLIECGIMSCNNYYIQLSTDDVNFNMHSFYEISRVTFGDIPDDVLRQYADSDEPLDKAGAYGIQGMGATLIEKIDGCYYNVKGFPLYRFCKEVADWLK